MIGESIGNYRIISKLGQGGMGTVYQAEDAQLGRKVAVKVLNSGLMEQGGRELERFKSEAKVQASLSNPNVVTLYDFVPYGDSFCMVMEYVEGKSLSELLRALGALPPGIVVSISRQILEGLSAAHRLGVVHRDLKPSNILLTTEGVAKVMDFGIAKVQGSKSFTATGALVGTVCYMSPEQVRGETVDARSDLYSFGIILFELLTGRVPFRDDSDFKIMVHHVQSPPPLPTQLLPAIPGDLEDIVMMCLKKDAAERFQSAEAILAALDSFEEQERAAGRGQFYTRRYLAQWLASPLDTQPSGRPMQPATFVGGQARQPGPGRSEPPTFAAPKSEPPSFSDRSVPASASGRPESTVSTEGTTRGKSALLLVPLIVVLLAGTGAAYYMLKIRKSHDASEVARTTQSAVEQRESQPPIEPASQPAAAQGITQAAAEQPPGQQNPAGHGQQPTARFPSGTAPEAASSQGGGVQRITQSQRPSVSPSAPASGRSMAGAPKKGAANPSGGLYPSAAVKSQPQQADLSNLPQGILIFFDAEESSERLPLSSAQSQAADIIRQAGHQVISTGIGAQAIRTALDQGDLASIRGRGIGYVVLCTAGGSLEAQSAYGNTYSVAKVTVHMEMLRMSDGSVVSHGNADARSRGSANTGSALSEALQSATSDSARELMRQFRP